MQTPRYCFKSLPEAVDTASMSIHLNSRAYLSPIVGDGTLKTSPSLANAPLIQKCKDAGPSL